MKGTTFCTLSCIFKILSKHFLPLTGSQRGGRSGHTLQFCTLTHAWGFLSRDIKSGPRDCLAVYLNQGNTVTHLHCVCNWSTPLTRCSSAFLILLTGFINTHRLVSKHELNKKWRKQITLLRLVSQWWNEWLYLQWAFLLCKKKKRKKEKKKKLNLNHCVIYFSGRESQRGRE